ncbi:late embryogenesis abundant protein At1g64065-like [Castanea sativa]|uniref:late embryogenesis abundant protein At1g64065-like n=1 Tax=Castanea sativa TaxID=21020 RepID=UPI003F654836
MADNANQHVYPKADEELATPTFDSKEFRRKNRIKLAINIAAFLVLQIIVSLVFSLIVTRFRTPKVTLGMTMVTFYNVNTSTTQTSPSFDMSFTTQVRVKNTNFGLYEYDSTNATFMYQGVTVAQVTIPNGKAGLRSTKKVSVTVNVNSNALPSNTSLTSELSAGFLILNSHAEFSGKVVLMFVMKKKSAEMNCTMSIDLSTKEVQAMSC